MRRGLDALERGRRVSALVPATGDEQGASYRFLDQGATKADYYYWLEAVYANGESEFFGPIAVDDPGDPGRAQRLFMSLLLRH